jgi:hypothetical protein
MTTAFFAVFVPLSLWVASWISANDGYITFCVNINCLQNKIDVHCACAFSPISYNAHALFIRIILFSYFLVIGYL